MGLSLDVLDPPLDDIAFLARSNNRVRVLTELAEGARTRRDLRDDTTISQPTLGRILEGFEERAWVTKNGQAYTLTPFGQLIINEFGDLMRTVETIQDLRDLAPWLPFDEMDFDIRALKDATITRPTPTDSSAHFRRENELLEQTARVQFLCNQAQPETIETYRDWVIDEDRSLDAIIAGDAIDAARSDDVMNGYLEDLIGSGRVTIHRYDGPVTIMLGLLDDTASIVPLDASGVPCAFIESDHDAVTEWVSEMFGSYREQSEPVTIETLTT